jgi:Protein of unknown function (DUF2490)
MACMALCAAKAYAAVPSIDSQLWSELDVTHAVSADLSATAIVTTRFGDGLPNPTLTAAGLQIDYRIGSWIVSGTGYYVSVRSAETGARAGIWLPAAALTYGMAVSRLALSDRNRVEQLEGLPGSPTRYRNRASAYWQVADGNGSAAVFITNELFYDFSRDRWTRNRAQAGLQFQLVADTKLQVYYMRQNNTYGTPDRLNVLGLTVQTELK